MMHSQHLLHALPPVASVEDPPLTPVSAPSSPQSGAAPAFQLGGQALIEGVMLRSRRYVAAAARRGDGGIEVRLELFQSILQRHRWLAVPLLRGVVALFEMMGLGMRYLNWSSNLALQSTPKTGQTPGDEQAPAPTPALNGSAQPNSAQEVGEALPWWMFVLTVATSLGFGLLLFVAAPYFITSFTVGHLIGHNVGFVLFEGVVKLLIFIGYLWLIGQRPNIRRVFEYHGAEHKVVYAAENKRPLTPEGARSFDTPHPRCGTGFALLTVLVSIVCFAFIPQQAPRLEQIAWRFGLMILVTGISFEVLKATTNPRWGTLAKIILTPGMWLQRLTTRQPNDEQLEVGCVAMRTLLEAEENADNPERLVSVAPTSLN